MKKSIRILALTVVAVMLCLSLASCGNTLKGEYESSIGLFIHRTMEFKGENVTVKYSVSDLTIATVEGTYTINGDKITFDFVDKSGAEHKDAEDFLATLVGELSFEKGDDYIEIGGVKYTKVKK